MKVSISYPSIEKLKHFVRQKESAVFNYSELNGTKAPQINGYDNDLTSTYIGEGEDVWNNAKVAIQEWRQFPSSWTTIYNNAIPPKTGNTVAVLFKLFGLWWINSARIMYTFNEDDRFGFAYGTLEGHVEGGEECFWIDRNTEGKIYYHIKAFSKPKFWGARLAYPLARMFQRRFVRNSMNIMKNLDA